MKKTKNSMKIIICVCIIFIITCVCALVITMKNNSFYKTVDRTNQIDKKQAKHKDWNILGWLKVQGTNIDFPIVYDPDGKYYENFDEDLGWSVKKTKKLTNKMVFLSHNLINISSQPAIADPNNKRFEQLLSFIYTDFVKKNKYIQYTIDGKNYTYKIFSISFLKYSDIDFEKDSMTTKEMSKYILQSKKDSYFDFNVNVKNTDKVISLVTCTRFFGLPVDAADPYAFKVDARLVRFGESTSNYDVKEKSNYKKIKNKLEGGEENEKI